MRIQIIVKSVYKMTKTKLSRREKEKLRHKKEIINAALGLFSEKGFYNVSMQEIADKSEFGVGTIYNFFQSKDALFEEIMEDAAIQIKTRFSEILDNGEDVKERLSEFITSQPQLQQQHGNIIRLLVSEFGVRGTKLRKITDKNTVQETMKYKLSSLIDRGINDGIFRNVDAEIAAKSLLATIETFVFETTNIADEKEIQSIFNKIAQLFLDGLLVVK